MNKLKHHFLGGLVFLGTITFGYIGYSAYTSLSIQNDGAIITKDIWNNVITTINDIGNRTDGIYSSGGNIGIGTNQGNAGLLHLKENVNDTSLPNGKPFLIVENTSNSTTAYSNILLKNGVGDVGGINISSSTHLGYGSTGGLLLVASDPFKYKPIVLATGNTPRITITGTGNVGIGTGSPSYKLEVIGTAAGVSWTNTSDERYKKDIETLTGTLEKIDKLRGVKFKRKSNEYKNKGFDNKAHLGFIAQEVENIYPEIVNTDNNGYKSVEYANITSILIEAVKELKKENEYLKIRLDKLENN